MSSQDQKAGGGPQNSTSPLVSNRNRTSYRRLELELELERNQLWEAGTVRLEAVSDDSSNSNRSRSSYGRLELELGLEL